MEGGREKLKLEGRAPPTGRKRRGRRGECAVRWQYLVRRFRVGITDPLQLAGSVKREVLQVDSDQPVSDIATLEHRIGESLAARRLTAMMLALFAGVAVLLAAIGLYGVMAFPVS